MPASLQSLLPILIVLLVVCLAVSIVMRLIRFIVVFAFLLVFIPAVCTVMWGDGGEYVSKFAAMFTPEVEETINNGYQAYHQANAEDPVVDIDQLEEYASIAANTVRDWFPEVSSSSDEQNRVFTGSGHR